MHWTKCIVHMMQDQYESSMMKKKALEEELEDLEGKLMRAEKLLSGTYAHSVKACTHQFAHNTPMRANVALIGVFQHCCSIHKTKHLLP